MRIKTPQYNGKDDQVMVLVVVPVLLICNSLYFGAQYYSSWKFFLSASLITASAFIIYFIICSLVAITFKKHFPREKDLLTRLVLVIITFLLMTGLFLYSLFRGYEAVNFFGTKFNEAGFVWTYFAMGIVNVFLTFVMEGIARYKDWKENLGETEKINAAYKQSQLNGLKSQVNPHFLFNSLNSLSSLIQEDEERAERFLDEMSKVYRYMLRNDEDQLVTLDTELKFLSSYVHLLNARFGEGLQVKLNIAEADKTKMLAPLTLQVIIENAFSQNIISRAQPLLIEITSDGNGTISIKNNVQRKAIMDTFDVEAGLDNLVKKYELLGKPIEVIDYNNGQRCISILLIAKKEEAVI